MTCLYVELTRAVGSGPAPELLASPDRPCGYITSAARVAGPARGPAAILAAMPTDGPRVDVDRLRSDPAAWDEFVRTTPGGGYLQLTGWATVKAANGWRAHRVVVDAGDGPVGVQLLVRKLGPTPFGVGYAPRGPVGADDPKSLQALTEALARLGRQEHLSHVTMDPGWAGEVPAAGDPADRPTHRSRPSPSPRLRP
jgi:hypothetical protein